MGWVKWYQNEELRNDLWQVTAAIRRWRFVPVSKVDSGGVVHAEISLIPTEGLPSGGTAAVTFFETACTPARVYEADLSWLDARTRYIFVAGHEVGHLVDYWAGGTPILGKSSVDIEKRATIYGSYFAECYLRLAANIYSRIADYYEKSGEPFYETEQKKIGFHNLQEIRCAVANWQAAQKAMGRHRLEWEKQSWTASDSSALASSGACRSTLPK